MRALLALAALATILVVPSWAVGTPHVPVWSPGDYWSYVSADIRIVRRLDVVAVENVAWNAANFAAYRLVGSSSISEGAGHQLEAVTIWYRTTDLAVFREQFTNGEAFTVTFDPPVAWLDWPLEIGHRWQQRVAHVQETGEGVVRHAFDYAYEVENAATVTVPAGTFETYAVHSVGPDGRTRRFYSPAAGNAVRVEGIDQGPEGDLLLIDYRLAHPPSSDSARPTSPFPSVVVAVAVVAMVGVFAADVVSHRSRRAKGEGPTWGKGKPPPNRGGPSRRVRT